MGLVGAGDFLPMVSAPAADACPERSPCPGHADACPGFRPDSQLLSATLDDSKKE
jgi:hypothetical protein